MITLEEAKNLRVGQILYHVKHKNADGTPRRWKVTSVKTWKTRPNEIRVGLKHGLYDYDYMTQNDLGLVNLNP